MSNDTTAIHINPKAKYILKVRLQEKNGRVSTNSIIPISMLNFENTCCKKRVLDCIVCYFSLHTVLSFSILS